jgi:hypothetical protein
MNINKWVIKLPNGSIIEFSKDKFTSEQINNLKNLKYNNAQLLEVTEPITNSLKTKQELIDDMFYAAWDYINAYYDSGGFIQMVHWRHSLPSNNYANNLIDAVNKWKDAVLFEYLLVKKIAIIYDQPYDMDYSFIGLPSM